MMRIFAQDLLGIHTTLSRCWILSVKRLPTISSLILRNILRLGHLISGLRRELNPSRFVRMLEYMHGKGIAYKGLKGQGQVNLRALQNMPLLKSVVHEGFPALDYQQCRSSTETATRV